MCLPKASPCISCMLLDMENWQFSFAIWSWLSDLSMPIYLASWNKCIYMYVYLFIYFIYTIFIEEYTIGYNCQFTLWSSVLTNVTNGLSLPYHLDEATFILGESGVIFHFYILLGHIWGYIVCLCPINRMPGLYELTSH